MTLSTNSILSIYDNNRKKINEIGILTSSFWIGSLLSQRVNGFIGMHGGRSSLLMSLFGLISVGSSIFTSNYITNNIINKKIYNKQNYYMKVSLLGLFCYSILESRLYRTMIPSSIITTGVMAKLLFKNTQSIVTMSPIATDSQRSLIQQYGKRFGCHQCGSKQLFNNKIFIADHMPPTKICNDMNNKWWRKLFNLKISQRLYAQCFNCYSLQGSAVKSAKNILVYHNGLYLHHFAPALALCLLENKDIDKWLNDITNKLNNSIKKYRKRIKDIKNIL